MSIQRFSPICPRIILLLALALAWGQAWSGEAGSEDSLPEAPERASEALPLDELRTFADILERIKTDYVEPVDDAELIRNAIRGMLAGLDPHSAYLDPEDYRELRVGTSGEFGGLGIEVGMEDGFVKVIAPIDDTPAQRAGLQAGDLIVRIDDQPVKGLTLNEAVQRMRGEPGTRIQLTLMRKGEDGPIELTLERAIIQVASVKRRLLEPGFGYVRIAHFQARTPEDMRTAIEALKARSGGALKGLVLDLRNNPGGVLNSAVSVSDAFLTQGLIVYTQGRDPASRLDFSAGPDDVLAGAPLVVLVNAGSASASEIVAGALQDQRRAVVLGQPTFGKGSVQTIVSLDDATALKLTTARYYTPSGRSIQAQGIVPDILLESGTFTPSETPPVETIKEANLARHLQQETKATEEVASEGAQTDVSDDIERPSAAEDLALVAALNVLKGLSLFGTAPGAGQDGSQVQP